MLLFVPTFLSPIYPLPHTSMNHTYYSLLARWLPRRLGALAQTLAIAGTNGSTGHDTAFTKSQSRPSASKYLVALLAILLGWLPAASSLAQCLPAWSYRAPITVSNTASPTALSDFQVKVTLNTAALIAAGKLQASGNDLRFVDASCTQLSYWIESGLNTATTVVWVKVPIIPGSNTTTITLYYGNATAPAASSGENTFVLFDNFDGTSLNTAKWNAYGTAPVVSGGTIQFASSTSSIIRSVAGYSAPVVAEANVTAASGNWPNIAQLASGTFNGYTLSLDGDTKLVNNASSMFLWRTYANGSSYAAGNSATDYTNTNTVGNLVGIWSLSWVNNQQRGSWPGGTLNLAGSSNAYPSAVQLAVGGLETGSGSMTVDWYRARKYAAAEPSAAVGAEQATYSLSTSALAATSYCAGSAVAVPFTATGTYAAGNAFTAQLSSATGDFTTPTVIGTLSATASGTISAVLPASTPAGSGYRIRVVSSSPALTGTDNGSNLTVNTAPTVTVPANQTVTNAPATGASVPFAATATGSPAPSIVYTLNGTPITSPYTFPVGTSTVTATATNGCGSDAKTFTVTVTTPPASVSVQYQTGDLGQPTDNQLRPFLQLVNSGTTAVPYSSLTVRYWLTVENFMGQLVTPIDYAKLGTSFVSARYVQLATPRQGAYGYIEYAFAAAAGNLAPGTDSGPIYGKAYKPDYTNFDETDDWSYQTSSAFTTNAHVTLYQNGTLINGTEPPAVTATTALQVFAASRDASASTSYISVQLQVRNTGNVPVNYSDVKARYYFTRDGASSVVPMLDYAKLGASNIGVRVVNLAAPVNGADAYLEVTFSAALGVFYPRTSTEDILLKLRKDNYQAFDQTNDYSFSGSTALTVNNRFPAYLNNALVFGTPPTGAPAIVAPTAEASAQAGASDASIVAAAGSSRELAFTASPNPFGEQLHLQFALPTTQAYTLAVYDGQGRLVQQVASGEAVAGQAQELAVPTQSYAAGFYLVRLTTASGVQHLKLIKQ